jgi:hypothetical protein
MSSLSTGHRQSRTNLKAIEAALATAKATVTALEAALASTVEDEPGLLDLKAIKAKYNIGRDALLAAARRGELHLKRVSRRIMIEVDELEAWLRSKPHHTRPRLASPETSLDEWERDQERELRALGGSQ